jgi:hypothetical protein
MTKIIKFGHLSADIFQFKIATFQAKLHFFETGVNIAA